MQLPGRPYAANKLAFNLMIFIWIHLLLQDFGVLALPNAGENFIPVPPPKHALVTDQTGPPGNETKHADHLLCTPYGACEPCPPEAMHEPFCQPFGNRRLMHCVNITSSRPPQPPSHPDSAPTHPVHPNAHDRKQAPPAPPPPSHGRPGSTDPTGEVLAWESCGRIPAKERKDFFEFVACNAIFAAIALGVLFFRERRLRLGRARMLAARIGVGAGGVLGRL
ncbi:hypothetical protein CVT26_009260 [Gymnopilus dilepis]|uniref:Copper transporter n=1 Tax=Gymnopilus dilepis TaxID=231916 RepID=A0A409WUR1_9AGAR|nr:hypothetical protein CVT26_009260 [Gymnopilus dilepis]